MQRVVLYAATAITIAITSACGGSGLPDGAPANERNGGPGDLQIPLALPPADHVPGGRRPVVKVASGSHDDYTIQGSEWIEKSAGATAAARIISDPGELEWAMYALPVADLQFGSVSASISTNDGKAWVALSDYSRNAWEVLEVSPLPPFFTSPTDNPQRFVSESGWVYLAVISADGSDIQVLNFTVFLDRPERADIGLQLVGLNGEFAMMEYEGRPVLLVLNKALDRVEYWDAQTPAPASWSDFDTHTVASYEESVIMSRCDIALVNGRPALAWGSASLGVTYAAASVDNPSSEGDWTLSKVGVIDSGYHPDLDEVDGKPVMVFYDWLNTQKTWFASSELAAPAGEGDWDLHQIKLLAGDDEGNNSLLIFNGVPHVLVHFEPEPDESGYALYVGEEPIPSNTFDWQHFELEKLFTEGLFYAYPSGRNPWAVIEGKPAFLFPAFNVGGDQHSYVLGQYLKNQPQDNSDIDYRLFDKFADPAIQANISRPADLKVFGGVPFAVTLRETEPNLENTELCVWRGVAPDSRDDGDFILDVMGEGPGGYGLDASLFIADGRQTLFYIQRNAPDSAELRMIYDVP